jgi:hypothetical protein
MTDPNFVRKFAEDILGTNEVYLVQEVSTGHDSCSLTMWSRSGSKPSMFVTLFEFSQEVICTTSDFQSFGLMLKVLRPDILQTDLLANLFRKAAPGRMSVVVSKSCLGWLKKYETIWHEPRKIENRVEFFCNDFILGRFFRVSISDNYDLELVDLGPGKKFSIR